MTPRLVVLKVEEPPSDRVASRSARSLPRERFPPRSTVYNIFHKLQRDGVWEAIWAEFRMALRERMGREASPSAAVLGSQIGQIKKSDKDNQVG